MDSRAGCSQMSPASVVDKAATRPQDSFNSDVSPQAETADAVSHFDQAFEGVL